MKTRKPAVAGRFYPDTPGELTKKLDKIRKKEIPTINLSLSKHTILGGIVPHAGYTYSAYQALHFFEILKSSKQIFDTFIIINPNHTGYGPEIALEENHFWSTPYGDVEVDKVFHGFFDFPESEDAHKYEHSGEVILPLLQYSLDYPFKILPITMFGQNPQNARRIANSIFEANKHLQKTICVIASSDFSHFVHPEKGKILDDFVIRKILDFDTEGVFHEVREKQISICGYGPIMALMEYTKLATEKPGIKILKTGHSGEIVHSKEVVNYVSALFYNGKSLEVTK